MYVDYAGPFKGRMFLIHTHSKYSVQRLRRPLLFCKSSLHDMVCPRNRCPIIPTVLLSEIWGVFASFTNSTIPLCLKWSCWKIHTNFQAGTESVHWQFTTTSTPVGKFSPEVSHYSSCHYRGNAKSNIPWKTRPSIIAYCLGPLAYVVHMDSGLVWRWHIDHLHNLLQLMCLQQWNQSWDEKSPWCQGRPGFWLPLSIWVQPSHSQRVFHLFCIPIGFTGLANIVTIPYPWTADSH